MYIVEAQAAICFGIMSCMTTPVNRKRGGIVGILAGAPIVLCMNLPAGRILRALIFRDTIVEDRDATGLEAIIS